MNTPHIGQGLSTNSMDEFASRSGACPGCFTRRVETLFMCWHHFETGMPFVCEFPLNSQFHVAECERLWKLEHGSPWYVQSSPRLWCFCQRHRSQHQGCSKGKKLNLQSGDSSLIFLVASWICFFLNLHFEGETSTKIKFQLCMPPSHSLLG